MGPVFDIVVIFLNNNIIAHITPSSRVHLCKQSFFPFHLVGPNFSNQNKNILIHDHEKLLH